MKIISKPHIYAYLFLLLISLAGGSHAQIPQPERDALMALYNSTGGADWSNSTGWMGAAGTECDWYGITCLNGSVTELRLSGNSLSGSIPSELGRLTNLTTLDLAFNSLSGSIPSELGNLTNLTDLFLDINSLSGNIPSELGNLTNLAYLYLNNNTLTGSIPSELGNLTNLIGLPLYNNSLTGSIPPELGNLSMLSSLHLGRNSLSGSIPSELGNLTNLTNLSLDENRLSGVIPPELGNLTNLTGMYLQNNSLRGSIPPELGSLINLTNLYLNDNSLTGRIPSELGNLTNLIRLRLDNNSLSGSIPTSLNSFGISDNAFNAAPAVSISDGNRTIDDTDGVAGEVVSVTATATDSDGELASYLWLIGDEVVASGTSARLPLSDGSTTVTFRATDDDGESTSTSVTITVEAPVETAEEFVTEYNGVAAPSFLSEEINTISVFDMNKLKLRSCIRLTLRGEPYSLNDYEQYDMNFNLLSLDDLTFRLVDFRPFNLNGSSNQFGETPGCSGQFELSSNIYKDIIAVPGTTEAGNLKYDYYDVVIDLIDMDSLLFRLRDISIITGPSSVR